MRPFLTRVAMLWLLSWAGCIEAGGQTGTPNHAGDWGCSDGDGGPPDVRVLDGYAGTYEGEASWYAAGAPTAVATTRVRIVLTPREQAWSPRCIDGGIAWQGAGMQLTTDDGVDLRVDAELSVQVATRPYDAGILRLEQGTSVTWSLGDPAPASEAAGTAPDTRGSLQLPDVGPAFLEAFIRGRTLRAPMLLRVDRSD